MLAAVITARGGSKRLPGKNILPFRGKPMLAWPIEACLACGLFDHVYVSTEDPEIRDVALAYGAEVPVDRPAELATDAARAVEAVRHTLDWVATHVGPVRAFAHLYPTAPLLKADDIRQAYALLEQGRSYVYTAQKISFPVYQIVTRGKGGGVENLFPPELAGRKSQQMPDAFIDAGQLYWYETRAFYDGDLSNAMILELPAWRAVDIDTADDLRFAELCAEYCHQQDSLRRLQGESDGT